MLCQAALRHDAANSRERMMRRDDRREGHFHQRLALDVFRDDRQGTDNSDAAAAVQHGLHHGTQGLDIEQQRRTGIGLVEEPDRLRKRGHRVHHVDHRRELGLEAFGHGAGARLEAVHAVEHGFRLDQQRLSLTSELRIFLRPVEELDLELRFEVRNGLTHQRLRAAQLAPGGGKAAGFRRGDEYPQLVERERF